MTFSLTLPFNACQFVLSNFDQIKSRPDHLTASVFFSKSKAKQNKANQINSLRQFNWAQLTPCTHNWNCYLIADFVCKHQNQCVYVTEWARSSKNIMLSFFSLFFCCFQLRLKIYYNAIKSDETIYHVRIHCAMNVRNMNIDPQSSLFLFVRSIFSAVVEKRQRQGCHSKSFFVWKSPNKQFTMGFQDYIRRKQMNNFKFYLFFSKKKISSMT